MKSNIRLYYSRDKANPKQMYFLRLALKKATLPFDEAGWTNAPEEEKKAVNFLLLTYSKQLINQQKTIESLETPVLTWVNPDSTLDIRVGYEDILKEI